MEKGAREMKRNKNNLEQIAEKSNTPILKVWDIFSEAIYKIYSRDLKKGERFKIYNEELDSEALKLTERYFKIYGKQEK